jgi:hypothetical protein
MSSITLFAVIVAVLCIFYNPGKVLAVITLLLVAGSNWSVAIVSLSIAAALFYLTKIKRK